MTSMNWIREFWRFDPAGLVATVVAVPAVVGWLVWIAYLVTQ